MTYQVWLEKQLIKYWGSGYDFHPTVLDPGNLRGNGATIDNLEEEVSDIEQSDKDTAISWIKAHPTATKFTRDVTNAVQEVRDFMHRTGYDKKFWSDEKIKSEYIKRYKTNADQVGQVSQSLAATIDNDTFDKFEAGAIDRKGNIIDKSLLDDTGALDTTKAENAGFTTQKDQVSKIMTDLGIKDRFGDEALDYFSKELKNGNLEPFTLKRLLQAQPEYLDKEYDEARAELTPELARIHKEELDLIEKESTRLRGVTEKVFKEDVAPTIRREVGLLGGRGREFHANALAKAASEMEERRQDVVGGMNLQAKLNEIDRQRSLAEGDFAQAKSSSNLTAEMGLKNYERQLTQRISTLNAMQNASISSANILSQRANQRFMTEYNKTMKRNAEKAAAAQKAASKKAGKLGLYANVFSGIALGALSGPVGAVVGGIAAYGSGELQRQSSGAIGGFSLADYGNIGAGAQDLYNRYASRKPRTYNNSRTSTDNFYVPRPSYGYSLYNNSYGSKLNLNTGVT